MEKSIFIDDKGFVVQVFGEPGIETVHFSAYGGGHGREMPRNEFFARFKPHTLPNYGACVATFDHFPEGESVPALTDGTRWNGWATPVFVYEEALKLLPYFSGLRYDEAKDAFLWTDEAGDGDVEEYRAMIVETDSGPLKVYPVGTWSWTWNLVGDD
ncbi:hypothetical protein [Burkholderia cenocepacia]|uniref:hypothetical protein n=1 Tax=Burkholderia cenocepacia TaxID=95486 RepID=UPI0007617EB8|nr:hypothetical protein [Burkholderia cenocepacia]KWU26382.1 hypothetical protein AS149_25675 [Burkholderia cenocepacia]